VRSAPHDNVVHDAVVSNATQLDGPLAARIRAGDPAAFDAMVVTHLDALVGFARSLVHATDTAEDVVQDVCASLWRRHAQLPMHGSLRAYLFTAVRNRVLDVLKHERVRERALTSFRSSTALFEEQILTSLNTEADDLTRTRLIHVHRALATLPERQRTALALRYERQLKIAEVAAVLDISVKAAEQLLIRAIRALRAAIPPHEP
jgi:RNA polymerase sigma-70 factor (ECF subfamily)